MSTAWRARREPDFCWRTPISTLLCRRPKVKKLTEGQLAPVDSQERLLAGLLGIGALISLASLAFAWASNGSLFTGYYCASRCRVEWIVVRSLRRRGRVVVRLHRLAGGGDADCNGALGPFRPPAGSNV